MQIEKGFGESEALFFILKQALQIYCLAIAFKHFMQTFIFFTLPLTVCFIVRRLG